MMQTVEARLPKSGTAVASGGKGKIMDVPTDTGAGDLQVGAVTGGNVAAADPEAHQRIVTRTLERVEKVLAKLRAEELKHEAALAELDAAKAEMAEATALKERILSGKDPRESDEEDLVKLSARMPLLEMKAKRAEGMVEASNPGRIGFNYFIGASSRQAKEAVEDVIDKYDEKRKAEFRALGDRWGIHRGGVYIYEKDPRLGPGNSPEGENPIVEARRRAHNIRGCGRTRDIVEQCRAALAALAPLPVPGADEGVAQ